MMRRKVWITKLGLAVVFLAMAYWLGGILLPTLRLIRNVKCLDRQRSERLRHRKKRLFRRNRRSIQLRRRRAWTANGDGTSLRDQLNSRMRCGGDVVTFEAFKDWMELLSYLVTVIGLPFAIFVFALEQRRERANEEEDIFQKLSDDYGKFMELALQNSDLQLLRDRATG